MKTPINWEISSELYSGLSRFYPQNSKYLRFPSTAEAVRFAIEEMSPAALIGVSIESGDERYEGEAISALYNAADYPLSRKKL